MSAANGHESLAAGNGSATETSSGSSNGTPVESFTPSGAATPATTASLPAVSTQPAAAARPFTPVAICGMACRLPGGIGSPSELWDFLLAKGDARSEVPETRFSLAGHYQDPSKSKGHRKPGTTVARHGYFLDSTVDLGALDTSFYPMPKSEVEQLDPQTKQLLEVARECLDDAGEVGWRGAKVGAYVGSFGNDWYDLYNKDERKYGMYQVSTTHDFTLSNRLSYELDLKGPSVTIRTACSSGLVGLNEACAAIAKGDCSSAIVGGTSIILAPALTTAMSEQGVLGVDGSCKTFSAAANGYARGEAIVALYVKSLADAVRDGNPVRAVVSGVATNSDGRTNGFSLPSASAQEALIRHTYRVAGIAEADMARTAFVECHGTGTPVGDPIETTAVARVFGAVDGGGESQGVHIGSIKPNLGHGEGASGLTSVIKAVLSLEHRTIPPNIKAWPLNPKIPFERNRLVVASEPTPWPADRLERVSVNSFGVGGANAHAIVDSPDQHLRRFAAGQSGREDVGDDGSDKEKDALAAAAAPHLLLFSANSQQPLKDMIGRYQAFASRAEDGNGKSLNWADLAYTLACHREHLPVRAFAVGTRDKPGFSSMAPASSVSPGKPPPSLVMVFTGQGAQWPQMGRELLRAHPAFQRTIRSLDQHLRDLLESARGSSTGPGANQNIPDWWSIEEELLKPARTSRVNEAEFSQPLCTALQVALVDSLAEVGIVPSAVVGHSSGEIAAAYAAGVLNAREALAVAFHRGLAAKQQTRKGAMAAVGMGWQDAAEFLAPGVVVACDNSPLSVTLSGDADAVGRVVDAVKEARPGVLATMLKVEKAYHSHHMVQVGDDYARALEAAGVKGTRAGSSKSSSVVFVSSVAGRRLGEAEDKPLKLDANYWRQNLESPVLFRAAVSSILLDKQTLADPVFLEVGPHAALAGPVRQILAAAGSDAPHVPTLTRKQNGLEGLLAAVGKLWSRHVPVKLASLMDPSPDAGGEGQKKQRRRRRRRCLPGLPTYPWSHQRSHWHESRVSREWRLRQYPCHDLLGARVAESSETEPVWRNLFHLDNAPWVRDHKIHQDIVFPFAGYVAMAAEAARQLSGVHDVVELRNVLVQTACLVTEGSPTELVTSLRRRRLTDSQDSDWWEFSVAAHNGHVWTKHAVGEVRATAAAALGDGSEVPSDDEADRAMPRRVDMPKYYERIRRGGLVYGPHFITIDEMRTATSGPGRVLALSRNNWHGDEANYHYLHPIVIDTYLQVHISAAQHALMHRYRQLVPLRAASIRLAPCTADDLIHVSQTEPVGDGYIGDGSVVACLSSSSRATVLKATGVHVGPLDSTANSGDGGSGDDAAGKLPITARQEWVPHIDFSRSLASLIRPAPDHALYAPKLEELGRLAIAVAQRGVAAAGLRAPAPGSHMANYLKAVLLDSHHHHHHHQPGQAPDTDLELLDALVSELTQTPAAHAAAAIQQVSSNAASIISGTTPVNPVSLSLLSKNDTLSGLEAWLGEHDASAFLRTLALSKPNLSVLELGAGQGAAAAVRLQALKRPDGQFLCSRYVVTDAHSGMVAVARGKLGGVFPRLDFATLDISKDPVDQHFGGGHDDDDDDDDNSKFDLVVAPLGTLHAAPDLVSSLGHVRKLLRPDGRLFVQLPRQEPAWIRFVLDSIPGRWNEGGVGLEAWRSALVRAGFQELQGDSSLVTADPLTHILVAQPSQPESMAPLPKCVAVVGGGAAYSKTISLTLESRGFEVTRFEDLTEACGSGQDIIALVDFDAPFFESMSEAKWEQLKSNLEKLGETSSALLWVTRPTQTDCQDPRYAPIVGFSRTVRSELSVDLATCETDGDLGTAEGSADVVAVFSRLRQQRLLAASKADGNGRDGELGPDFEYAIQQGTTYTNRFFPFRLQDELQSPESSSSEATLKITKPGRIESLEWRPQAAHPAPVADEVEVEVRATGLNFRDVLVAMGIISLSESEPYFGYEASGVVRRVGPDAKKVQAGDRVVLSGIKTFSTVVTSMELLVEKLPDGLSFVEGASMPLVFTTAIYSLLDVGRLQPGQSVLIHSGCGGVGLAAIQIAQMTLGPAGSIYTTVSSEEKAEYLVRTYGLRRSRILNSRSASFVDDLLRETGGRGVDLALNSLAGELLHATWRCVAKWGAMVEIGKRDLLGRAKLDMDVFVANRSYCCVDIDQMREERPALCDRLLARMMDFYRAGHIRPVRLAKVAGPAGVQEVFRYMQQGSHIGKIVITMAPPGGGEGAAAVATTRAPRELRLNPDASYLLVGGLGGLGRTVALWMVEHGARHLTFLSRSAGSGSVQNAHFAAELRSLGCRVDMVGSSVADGACVGRAVAGLPRPLAGVVQMSMVLRDAGLGRMTLGEWDAATAPKVAGTWNLHHAMQARGIRPDFFVLFSSLSGVLGQVGQSNYAAANTFLDAFVQFRRRRGLACSAVQVGAVEGAGHLFGNAELLRKMQGTGWRSVKEEELVAALELAMLPRLDGGGRGGGEDEGGVRTIVDKHNMLLGITPDPPLGSPNSSARLRRDVRMAAFHNVGGAGEGGAASGGAGKQVDALRAFIAKAKADPALLKSPEAAAFLAREIGKKLFVLLMKPDQEPNISASLAEVGLDSMIAVEMRAWWKGVFGLSISVLDMLAMGTLEALGKRVAEELGDLY